MKKLFNSASPEAEVDMTPMLDIVFILLIFFIVTSTLVRESGLDVTQNQSDEDVNQQSNASAIYVQLCSERNVFIDRRAVDIRSLRPSIEAKLALKPNSVVILETLETTPTQTLVTAMDQAIAANANVSVSENFAQCREV